MRSARYAIYASVVASLSVFSGCGGNSGDTINNHYAAPNDPLLADHSDDLAASPWNAPRSILTLHQETTGLAWTVGPEVAAGARPNALNAGSVADGSRTEQAAGHRTCEPTSSLDSTIPYAVVRQETTHFLEGLTGLNTQLQLALGDDRTIYSAYWYTSPPIWRVLLPASMEIGTTWQSGLLPTATVGKAFAYAEVGSVAFRPIIRTKTGTPAPGADPQVQTRIVAVDGTGAETADPGSVAVDYTNAPGYSGKWVDVERVATLSVTATDATTPDSRFSGCIQVTATFRYRLSSGVPSGATHIVGLDRFAGGYVLYWKPGVGWVHWSGHETIPDWGFTQLTSPDQRYGGDAFSLASYNAEYDAGVLGYQYGPYATIGQAYKQAWDAGYGAGYRDTDSGVPWSDRKSSGTALHDYLQSISAEDPALLTWSGSARGKRDASEAAFIAGYALGSAYYDTDFTAVAGTSDVQAAASTRSFALDRNLVPDEFRPDGILFVDNLDRDDLIDGKSRTGHRYPHGYDGLGEQIDAYDGSIGTGLGNLRIRKDAAGREMRNVYISLPVIGTTTTRRHDGATTDVTPMGIGNG